MTKIIKFASRFKSLSRLDSILLAASVVATGFAGYAAYDSYIKTTEITALYSQVESLESRFVEMSGENSLYQSDAEANRREARNAKIQAASLGDRVQVMEREAEAYRDLLLKASQEFDNYERRIKGLDGVLQDALGVIEEEMAKNNAQQAVYQYTAPQYTAPATQYSFSEDNVTREVRNNIRNADIESEIYSVSAKIATLRASYSSTKGALDVQYNTYSEQARQAYINYMMLERDTGNTESEQAMLRNEYKNVALIGEKADAIKNQIDQLTEQYNSDVAELENYKAKLQKQLN